MADFEKVKKALNAYKDSKSNLESIAEEYLKNFVKKHGGEYEFRDNYPSSIAIDCNKGFIFYCVVQKVHIDEKGNLVYDIFESDPDWNPYDELQKDAWIELDYCMLMNYPWDELE